MLPGFLVDLYTLLLSTFSHTRTIHLELMNFRLFILNEILGTVLNLHFLVQPDQAWRNDLQQELQEAKDLLERHWKEHHVSGIEA